MALLKIEKNGVVIADSYGKKQDVTESVHEYLNCAVRFEYGDVLVVDIYRMIAKNPVLKALYRRNFVESFIEYLEKFSQKKLEAIHKKVSKNYYALEYIELSRVYNHDEVNQVLDLTSESCLYVTGMSKVLTRAYSGFKKGSRVNFSVSMTPVEELCLLPVKYNPSAITTSDNYDSPFNVEFIQKNIAKNKEFFVPDLTLNELLSSVTWELSFHGSPSNVKEQSDELKNRFKDYKLGDSLDKICQNLISNVHQAQMMIDEIDGGVDFLKSFQAGNVTAEEVFDAFIASGKFGLFESIAQIKDQDIDFLKRFVIITLSKLYLEEADISDYKLYMAIAEKNLNVFDSLVEEFKFFSEKVIELIKNHKPTKDSEKERNNIALEEIALYRAKIENKTVLQKDLKFAIEELKDVIDDLAKNRVTEIFVHIDEVNRKWNQRIANRYNEYLYGFEKLPENVDLEALGDLIRALPNNASFSAFVDVMFQSSAKIKDEVKEFSAYEYRLKRELFIEYGGYLFCKSDRNKALLLEKKEDHDKYVQERVKEGMMTEDAKKIVSEGRSLFMDAPEIIKKAIASTHKMAVAIRPDISLNRWKTIFS